LPPVVGGGAVAGAVGNGKRLEKYANKFGLIKAKSLGSVT